MAAVLTLLGIAGPPATAADATGSSTVTLPYTFESTRTVLSKDVIPSRYRLALDLDPASATFGGRVAIDVHLASSQPAIELHAVALSASAATFQAAGGPARALRVDIASGNRWRLVPIDGQPLPAGDATLQISYTGQVNRTGIGLYRAGGHGAEPPLLATQNEPDDARRVLPAFDEPVFRAVFEVEVTAPKGLQVLSNMPATGPAEPTGDDARERHRFAPTPAMPSYLLAVAVGRFDVLEGRAGTVPTRIVAPAGRAGHGTYAIEQTARLLPWYEQWFGQPYALPRLDQIAIPDTRSGAMEDWGLISYSEPLLLLDPARAGQSDRETILSIVAHEIAHQWFGNLVSVAGWDEIWLNEAFATWMASKAVDHFEPGWLHGLRETANAERVRARDASVATHPIRGQPVPEDRVFQVFDGITYVKGGAVLAMLERWIGADAFQRGIAAYMQARRLQPATAGDLWQHLGRAAGRPVADVASTWTDQAGMPLVTARLACRDGRSRLDLAQQRLYTLPPATAMPAQRWAIPLRIAHGNWQQEVLLQADRQRIEWAGCRPGEPLLLNAGGLGWFRSDVDAAQQRAIAAAWPRLPAADRVALLSDSFALMQAGRREPTQHLRLLDRLTLPKDAGDAVVWQQALGQFDWLQQALADTPLGPPLTAQARRQMRAAFDTLGWQARSGEPAADGLLRAGLVARLAALDDEAVLAGSRARLRAALGEPGAWGEPLDGDLRSAVLQAVGSHADDAETARLVEALKNARGAQRWEIGDALASHREPSRQRALLDLLLEGGGPSDLASWLPHRIGAVSRDAAGLQAHVLGRWPAWEQRLGAGVFSPIAGLLPALAAGSSERAAAQRMVDAQVRHVGEPGRVQAEVVQQRVEVRARLRERILHPAGADALR